MKHLSSLRALFAATLALSATSCSEVLDPIEPVKVGLLNPLSGNLGPVGNGLEQAANLAREQINSAGGVFAGRPLEFIIADTKSTNGGAEEAALTALDEGAVALIGPARSGGVAQVLPLAQGGEIPQLGCCATSAELTTSQRDRQGWFFRTTPSDLLQGQALASIAGQGFYGENQRIDSCPVLGLLHLDDAYGNALADVVETYYAGRDIKDESGAAVLDENGQPAKGRVIARVPYPTELDDATATLDTFMPLFEAGHDPSWNPRACVVVIGFPIDGALIVTELDSRLAALKNARAATVADYTLDVQYLATDGLNANGFAQDAGDVSLKVVGTTPAHTVDEGFQLFEKAYKALFGDASGVCASNIYDAVVLTGLAITQAESTDGPAIQQALFDVSAGGARFEGAFYGEMAQAILNGDDIDYAGASGEVDFDDAGDVIGDYAIWRPRRDGTEYSVENVDFMPASSFSGG